MKLFSIQLSLLDLAAIIPAAVGIILFIWMIGYSAGVRKAERQFCDKFVRED